MKPEFTYSAILVRVVDADTMVVDIDLGFRVIVRAPLRLLGVDAPELRTPEGKAARDAVRKLVRGGSTLVVRTHRNPRDKYGRWLAEVQAGELDICQWLLANGHAKPLAIA